MAYALYYDLVRCWLVFSMYWYDCISRDYRFWFQFSKEVKSTTYFWTNCLFLFFLLVGRKDTYGNWKFRKIEKLWERKIENLLFCLWFGEWRVKCIYIAWVFVNWDGNFNAVLSIGFLCKGDNWVKLGQFGTYYCSKIKHLREKKKNKNIEII